MADQMSSRQVWAQACQRIALISGILSLVLGGLLIVNSFRIYQGPGNGKLRLVEASQLLPLKAQLREDPKNESLKQKIRQLDQQLRQDYFRSEKLATRGAWSLMAGVVVFLTSLQLARHLKRPAIPIPDISSRPEDPVRASALAAKAVTGTALGLAGLTISLVWGVGRQWQVDPTNPPDAVAKPVATEVNEPSWFAPAEEFAENWHRFRGPDGSGHTTLTDIPETWDGPTGQNVLWKSGIELPGENSPVIWGNKVFVTGADEKRREIYCFDATTGDLLWKEPVGTPQGAASEPPEVLEDTGYAAPTATTDGRRVFAVFANGDIAGFTTEGKRMWARSLGTPVNMYGHAASLMMWRDLVIVVFDQAYAKDEKSKIMALDAATGTTVWSTPRRVANSWVSPILINHQGREQIITSADPWVIAYDPATGKELWKADCMKGDVAPSPVFANDLIYVGSDHAYVAAIKPDGSGDVTETMIAWKNKDAGLPDMSSMFCDGPRVYTLVFGVFHAFDALTGEHLWKHNTDTAFQSSPSWVNGRIHLLSSDGEMIIGEASAEGFKETGRAALGEGTGASPSFAPGRIYLRGKKHLFCIGTKDGK
jgi:outer membrane protein assembly factor BamB